jgi:hypothetical protein
MPQIDTVECVAVGPTTVPPGFRAADDGWGARAILPTLPCGERMRAAIGSAACVPLAGCDAAFPPANATIVVRSGATPNAEGTLFADLPEAVRAAKAGAVIAIDAGTYSATTFEKNLTIVGACAAKTTLRPAQGSVDGAVVGQGMTVSVRGLTFRGFPRYALIAQGRTRTSATVEDCAFVDNNQALTFGAHGVGTVRRTVIASTKTPATPTSFSGIVAGYGAVVSFEDSEMRGMQIGISAVDVGTSVTLKQAVIHQDASTVVHTAMLQSVAGATISVAESHVASNLGRIGAAAKQPGPATGIPNPMPATLAFERCELVQAGSRRDDMSAIDVTEGSSLTLREVRLVHDSFTGIGLADAATAKIENSAVIREQGTREASQGVIVDADASVTITGTAFVRHMGVAVLPSGTATIERCDFVEGRRGSLSAPGAAVFVGGGIASIRASAFARGQGVALLSTEGGKLLIDSVVVDGDGEPEARQGVVGISSGIALENSLLRNLELGAGYTGTAFALLRNTTITDCKHAIQLESHMAFQNDAPAFESINANEVHALGTSYLRNGVDMVRGTVQP